MNRAHEKETIITIVVGSIVLFAVFSHRWMWMMAIAVGVAGLISDKLTHWIHVGWFWIAQKIGYVVSRVILAALFVVILLPLAMVAKIFRKDFMLLKKNYPSYYLERDHVYQRKDLENLW